MKPEFIEEIKKEFFKDVAHIDGDSYFSWNSISKTPAYVFNWFIQKMKDQSREIEKLKAEINQLKKI